MHFSDDVLALNPELRELKQTTRKYGNEPVEIDGIKFDSQVEGNRYAELRLLERAGEIRDLSPSPGSPKQRFHIGAGRYYTPDFVYSEGYGQMVAEDVKGKTAK